MTSFWNRIVAALRSLFGRPDVPTIELPMTPSHGWLLPTPAVLQEAKAAAPRDARGSRA
jgi:hypothetical protein